MHYPKSTLHNAICSLFTEFKDKFRRNSNSCTFFILFFCFLFFCHNICVNAKKNAIKQNKTKKERCIYRWLTSLVVFLWLTIIAPLYMFTNIFKFLFPFFCILYYNVIQTNPPSFFFFFFSFQI